MPREVLGGFIVAAILGAATVGLSKSMENRSEPQPTEATIVTTPPTPTPSDAPDPLSTYISPEYADYLRDNPPEPYLPDDYGDSCIDHRAGC